MQSNGLWMLVLEREKIGVTRIERLSLDNECSTARMTKRDEKGKKDEEDISKGGVYEGRTERDGSSELLETPFDLGE